MILPFVTADEIDRALDAARQHLRSNRVLAYPTETSYGLGTLVTKPALEALGRLKEREAAKPFLLLVEGRIMAESWGLRFEQAAERLAAAFWPGPLTLVLAVTAPRLPDMLRGPSGGAAVRHSSHPGAAALVHALGEPITSTSANRADGTPASSGETVASVFGPEVETGELLVLDGGSLPAGPPSSLVDCTGPQPRLLREGAIRRAELERVLGNPLA
jgi:L-threonylcarbamoyladenylate synthase